MLKQIRRRLAGRVPVQPYSVGPDSRVYAIGDVHGRADLLERLLAAITEDNAARGEIGAWHLVFLGDLIDRGPDSRRVVEIALSLCRSIPCTVLMGNHEEVMRASLAGNVDALRLFLRFGGYETLQSYGLSVDLLDHGEIEEIREAMHLHIPEEHRVFIDAMPSTITFGDYVFVHAGIRPGIPIDQQVDADLHWIRRDFLDDRSDHQQMIVHGHTISDQVEERENRIGIDTGAYRTGRLTAVCLQDHDRWYINT